MSRTLTIPDMDEAVEQKLRVLAANHGRTMQAEAREILISAVTAKEQEAAAATVPPPQHLLRRASSTT